MKAAVLALALVPATALADGEPAPAGPSTVTPAVPTPVKTPEASGTFARQEVAASNRGMAAPTALTVPAGEVEVTIQSLVPFAGVVGVNAGLTSATEVWAEGAAGYAGNAVGEWGAGIKQTLFQNRHLALSAFGSARAFAGNGEREHLFGVGGVATVCLDDQCALEISGSVARMWGFDESVSDENGRGENLFTGGVSLGNRTTRFLVDAMWLDRDGAGFLGLRFGTGQYAVDLGLVRPISEGLDSEIPGLPWISFSVRP